MVVNKGRRSQLRRKYLSLGLGELFAVTLFIWVVFLWSNLELFSDQERRSFLAGFAGLVIVLTQAGMYWLLARRWVEVRPMPRQLARLYRLFQVFDVLVLLAAGAYIAVHLPRTGWAGIASVTVWLFAVVEFVNYYMVRLSYPWTQWLGKVTQWRTPRLVQDLRSGDRTVA
ncbi:MAG: hypothetical protein WBG89_05145 [Ornithinimicrobium sp.]